MAISYTIREVNDWGKNGVVDIPALQRGLVWAPEQVELLWDSILRGFPIGAFVVTKVKGAESQSKRKDGSLAKYFLLDGQQRYNAIQAGFTPWSDGANSVLWLDLMPPTKSASTRRYWVKVITRSHPWGFGNDDGCSVLGWSAYRAALEAFGYSPDTKVKDVRMSTAWPVKAGCPIPLSVVMSLHVVAASEDAFASGVIDWIDRHPRIGAQSATRDPNTISRVSREVYQALLRMRQYQIVTLELPHAALEEQDAADVASTLRLLVKRLHA